MIESFRCYKDDILPFSLLLFYSGKKTFALDDNALFRAFEEPCFQIALLNLRMIKVETLRSRPCFFKQQHSNFEKQKHSNVYK